MAKCKNCGSGGGMAPAQIDPQGFQQATMQGNQIIPGQGTSFTPGPSSSALKGSAGFIAQSPNYTPQQQGITSGLLQHIPGLLQQILSGEGRYNGFEGIEQANQDRWRNDVLPSLANQFTNMTGSSQFGGGGYNQEIGKAYNQSAVGLGALKSQYGLQNQGQQQQLLQLLMNGGLQPQFQTNYISPTEGILGKASPWIGRALSSLAGAGIGGLAGGPAGALAGGAIGAGVYPQK